VNLRAATRPSRPQWEPQIIGRETALRSASACHCARWAAQIPPCAVIR
jgi:hypothetical protein